MTITPLPGDTTRVLTSAVVLNDATSVIKELVDNALDAHATSIAIEISANTLDVIQVKDNGTGIGIEDRQQLCKHGHTSKIRTLEDLEKLGGKSLGFRGEALASAAALSDSILITTRVEGEIVASTLTFNPSGQLINSASASHPVGTTVKVRNLLSSIPVRKQVVLKTATKILTNIKNLLYHYAFARPTIRFALKVLKGKNDKACWSFAPCDREDSLPLAAAKVVGKDVANLCKQYSISSNALTNLPATSKYNIDALFLDSTNAGISQAGNMGQYVSIDQRPVTVDRGICKEFAKLYKRYLSHACIENISIPQQPFFCLHLRCSTGVYDVNIEPAKDEVAFHETSVVRKLVQELLIKCYGEIDDTARSRDKSLSKADDSANHSFDILLARKQPTQPVTKQDEGEQLPSNENANPSLLPRTDVVALSTINETQLNNEKAKANQPQSMLHRNIFATDDDDISISMPQADLTKGDSEYFNPTKLNVSLHNPFTTAKLHARLPPKDLSRLEDASLMNQLYLRTGRDAPNVETQSPWHSHTELPTSQGDIAVQFPYLPTPSKSPIFNKPYQNPGPPLRRRAPRVDAIDEIDAETDHMARAVDHSHGDARLLKSWAKPQQLTASDHHAVDLAENEAISMDQRDLALNHRTALDFSALRQDTVRSSNHNHQAISHKPFRSPLKRSMDGSNAQNHRSRLDSGESAVASPDTVCRSNSLATHNAELDQIMDFEHQKRSINLRRKPLQSRLNPADLAQIQKESFNGISSSTTPIPSTSSKKPDGSESQAVEYASKFANAIVTPATGQESYTNRQGHCIPLHKLNKVNTTQVAEQGQVYNLGVHATPTARETPSASKQMLPKSMLAPPVSHSLITPPKSALKPKAKQQKTSQLPLETITKEAIKHNIVATPSDPFPTSTILLSQFGDLKAHDEYVQRGENKFQDWSPYSRNVNEWQERLKDMVQTMYRVGNRDKDQEGTENNTVPQIEIALVRAIKGHIEISASEKGI